MYVQNFHVAKVKNIFKTSKYMLTQNAYNLMNKGEAS